MPYFFDKAPRQNVRELKMKMRETFKAKRKALAPETKAMWDEKISQRLASLVSVRYADEILSFSPIAGEVNISGFNDYAMKSGKDFYLPRCRENGEMDFHLVKNAEELENGSFSIKEPSADAPIWKNENGKRAVCIIPAMSYDKKGFRLGYGKGYYDRHLSSKNTLKIGVCYTSFISDSIPRGRFDLSVDIIVTEKGIITIEK